MASDDVAAALDRGDVDELIGVVDQLCGMGAWPALSELVDRCRRAHEQSGRQLWPVATHGEYRLALEAPGEWAASVLVEGAGRFALGPLPEVAASTHTWGELAPHVAPGPAAVLAAHERVVRGDDLVGTDLPGPPVLDLPLRLEEWEPRYCAAEYHAHEAHFPAPPLPPLEPVGLPTSAARARDRDPVDAFLGVVAAWTTGSGVADACAVDGQATDAIAALGCTAARVASLPARDALAQLGWAGASGGAHGRRPGAAAGRFSAWWVVASLGGMLDAWPVDADMIGDTANALRWFVWDTGAPIGGWVTRIAVESPQEKRAWALDAHDPGGSAP